MSRGFTLIFFSAFLEEFFGGHKIHDIFNYDTIFFLKCSVILIHKISLLFFFPFSLVRCLCLLIPFSLFISIFSPYLFSPYIESFFFRTCSSQKCHFQPLISSNCNIFKKNIGGENSFFFLKIFLLVRA